MSKTEPVPEPEAESKLSPIEKKAVELLETHSPLPEPSFMELQSMLFKREAEVFPVILSEKFQDPDDFDNPVKVIEKPAPGFYVMVLDIDDRAKVAKWVDNNDPDVIKKTVKLCLCDKNRKRLIDPKMELAGPADLLILSAYECAMIANRFWRKKWNPIPTIAKNS